MFAPLVESAAPMSPPQVVFLALTAVCILVLLAITFVVLIIATRLVSKVPTAKRVTGVVVRPRSNAGPQIFLEDEVRELLTSKDIGGRDGRSAFSLSVLPLQLDMAHGSSMSNAHCPVYDPATNAIYYAQGSAIMRIDSDNHVSEIVWGRQAGRGPAPPITALAPGGDKGSILIAAINFNGQVLQLDVLSGAQSYVAGVRLGREGFRAAMWFNAARDVLVAAAPRVLAGSSDTANAVAARLAGAVAVAMRAGGALYLVDGSAFRVLDVARNFRYHVNGGMIHCKLQTTALPGGRLAVSILGSRNLVIVHNSIFDHYIDRRTGRGPRNTRAAASHQHPSAAMPAWLDTLTAPASDACAGGVVKVTSADGSRVFWVHASALTQHSDYFKRLLEPNGGFGDSGAAEVHLPNGTANAEAFRWLLSYMYGGDLIMPEPLLRPAAELAGWLLLPAECTRELQRRLMASVTHGSVLSDLAWAERHGFTELVPQLKAYVLQHSKQVAAATMGQEGVAGSLRELMTSNPDLAAELVFKLLKIPAV